MDIPSVYSSRPRDPEERPRPIPPRDFPASTLRDRLQLSRPSPPEAQFILLRRISFRVNELLGQETGAPPQMRDFTPEGTAEQVVGMALAAYHRWAWGKGREEAEEGLARIQGAVEQGYREAQAILQTLGVHNGAVKESSEKTYALAQQKMGIFAQETFGE